MVEREERPRGRAPDPDTAARERLLREQELSVERQREGRGWSELPTEQDVQRQRGQAPGVEGEGPTPAAATAEEQGGPSAGPASPGPREPRRKPGG